MAWATISEGMTGEEFRRRREALRLTQTQLADKFGVALRTLQYWERAISLPAHLWLALAEIERQSK